MALTQWLTFQNQDATDFGTNAANGTLTGTPTFNTGVSPPAIQLNGTTRYVSGTNHPVSSQTTNITLCCWVNLATTNRSGMLLHVGDPAASGGFGDGYGIGVGDTTVDSLGNNLVGLVDQVAWLPFATAIGTGVHHIALTRDTTTWRGYIDGVLCGTTFTHNPLGTSAGWAISRNVNSAPRLINSEVQDARFYNTRLNDAQVAALFAAGPQSAPTGTVLAADAGAYTLTGPTAALKRTQGTPAGSYTITGTAAAFLRKQVAAAGSYTITGTAAALKRGQVTPAGSYTITGTTAALLLKQVAAAGSYTLTGSAATFAITANVVLPAAAGAYSLTGSAAAFQIGGNAVLATDPGAYTLTGAAATFAISDNRVLAAAAGAYALTGAPASFVITAPGVDVIPVGKADILFSGQNVTISTTGEQPPIQLPGGGGGVTVPPWRDLDRKRRRRYRALEEIEKRLDERIERLTEQVAQLPAQLPKTGQPHEIAFYAQLNAQFYAPGQFDVLSQLHEAQKRAEKVRQEKIALINLARQIAEDEEEAIIMVLLFH